MVYERSIRALWWRQKSSETCMVESIFTSDHRLSVPTRMVAQLGTLNLWSEETEVNSCNANGMDLKQ